MPGWIIQGVRGEGKSLAAVGKIKEYMSRGSPVATNLDLYLEHLLPPENGTLAYRLPDHPRLEDFELLPPAYDVKYKGEDKNGLLVLDELGTWLNSRSWNDKTRLKLLNWLFLSRKNHWDLILLAQDHEMIDGQVRSTLCDYLVQASRSDRSKIPYLAPIIEFFGFKAFMPKSHYYHVFYGLSTAQKPTEVWHFTGKDLYDAYDTNQRFRDGLEPMLGTLVDMRATYTYLPSNYLTGQVFIDRLQGQIKLLRDQFNKQENVQVALKRTSSQDTKQKAVILSVLLVLFLGWRFMSGGFSPKPELTPVAPAAVVPAPVAPAPVSSAPPASPVPAIAPLSSKTSDHAVNSGSFVSLLFDKYKPRLSSFAYSDDDGFFGFIDFYDGAQIVERFNIRELHSLGISVVKRPYGVDLLYAGQTFIVSSWLVSVSRPNAVASKS